MAGDVLSLFFSRWLYQSSCWFGRLCYPLPFVVEGGLLHINGQDSIHEMLCISSLSNFKRLDMLESDERCYNSACVDDDSLNYSMTLLLEQEKCQLVYMNT